tara:strand:+ start:807 stop:1487 length:681 start_codon:yes stop_codon:yes gene_type:complete
MKKNSWMLNELKIIAKVLLILSLLFIDFDGDQLSTYSEIFSHSTNAFNSDSDNDQLTDGEELLSYYTNPKMSDTDSDGLSDGEELLLYIGSNKYQTNPLVNDSDYDGLLDGEEVNKYLTDPNLNDTDGDTLLDGEEVNTHRTDPNLIDTDGDSLEDNYELTPRYLGSTGAYGTYCEKRFYPGSDPTKFDTYNIGNEWGDTYIHKYTYICIDPYCGTLVTKFCDFHL